MKTLIKWVAIVCIIGWAAHNPGPVQQDVQGVMSAGMSVANSLGNAAGSALSGVSSGITGSNPAPAVPAPAATPGH
jgi:hypothetical protein